MPPPARRPDDLDWFVPHQENKRIIDASAEKLKIAPVKVVITVDRHGNTSAASSLALDASVCAMGRIREGHLVMLEAMGGGFHWGVGADPLVIGEVSLANGLTDARQAHSVAKSE